MDTFGEQQDDITISFYNILNTASIPWNSLDTVKGVIDTEVNEGDYKHPLRVARRLLKAGRVSLADLTIRAAGHRITRNDISEFFNSEELKTLRDSCQ